MDYLRSLVAWLMLCVPVPTALGVYVESHVLVPVEIDPSVQVVNEPDPLVLNVTVPVGDGPPDTVFVTVAVHVLELP